MSVGEELRLAVRLVVVGDGVGLDVGLGVGDGIGLRVMRTNSTAV